MGRRLALASFTILAGTILLAGGLAQPAGAQMGFMGGGDEDSTPLRRPGLSGELLNLQQAREYMLGLINRDRTSAGAGPVVFDEVANRAGQIHSDEMAQYGYLSHWTMDGRKPDQRYTECGGKDTVMENVDGQNYPNPPKFPLCKNQMFSKQELDEVEGQFFNEKPPNDGHRVNIIDPNHTAVGLGISVAGAEPGSGDGFPRVAIVQEFINHYGEYADLAQSVAPGDSFSVEGTLAPGVHFDCVDLRWEKFPESMSIGDLNKTHSYGIPDQIFLSYFPQPYESPAPVVLSQSDGGEHFAVQIPTGADWKPGLYYVTVWAKKGNSQQAFGASTRTIKIGGGGKASGRGSRTSSGSSNSSGGDKPGRLARPSGS